MALGGTVIAGLLLKRFTTIFPAALDMVTLQIALPPTASFAGLQVKLTKLGVDQSVNVVA